MLHVDQSLVVGWWTVRVVDMLRVVEGQLSDVFQRNKTKEHPKHLSFSLYYQMPGTRNEVTLDVVCRVSCG